MSGKLVRTHKKPIHSSNRLAWILMAAGALILLTALAFLLRPPADAAVSPARKGAKLSDFQLEDLDGNLVHLSDYAGKTVLINSWASWCPPCRAEMPELLAFYREHHDQDFVILAINAGESPATARAFADQMGLVFPVLLDANYRVLDGLGITSYPTSILVSPDGVIEKIKVGMFLPGELEKEIGPYLPD